jgi:hypothetical protein
MWFTTTPKVEKTSGNPGRIFFFKKPKVGHCKREFSIARQLSGAIKLLIEMQFMEIEP